MAGLASVRNSDALQQWQHLFEAHGLRRTQEARKHMQQLQHLGLPTRKHEDWKYTPLDGLLSCQFAMPARVEVTTFQRDALALPINACRLVFVDGRFSARLSDCMTNSGYDVTVDDQRQSLPDPIQGEVFLHLTESLAETVTHISVARNHSPALPLLMHISSGSAADEMHTVHYRHHLSLGEGASQRLSSIM